MQDQHFRLRPLLLTGIVVCALALGRLGLSVVKLVDGKPGDFLAFPLMVHSACATLFYVIRMSGTRTSEGSMMRLAALALILMILGHGPPDHRSLDFSRFSIACRAFSFPYTDEFSLV
ncbi:hypothetical protein [Rhizobium sp. R634]|uniref:hypothetical protein n=1 Tax=Rhizobium sp. R634 TaxID=1764274 RepID=UPI0011321334|nr:hypothetical protein [Rhizobium sp. R634]